MIKLLFSSIYHESGKTLLQEQSSKAQLDKVIIDIHFWQCQLRFYTWCSRRSNTIRTMSFCCGTNNNLILFQLFGCSALLATIRPFLDINCRKHLSARRKKRRLLLPVIQSIQANNLIFFQFTFSRFTICHFGIHTRSTNLFQPFFQRIFKQLSHLYSIRMPR